MLVPDLIYETLLKASVNVIPQPLLQYRVFRDHVTKLVLDFPYMDKRFKKGPGKMIIESKFYAPTLLLPYRIAAAGRMFTVTKHELGPNCDYLHLECFSEPISSSRQIKMIIRLRMKEDGKWHPYFPCSVTIIVYNKDENPNVDKGRVFGYVDYHGEPGDDYNCGDILFVD